ncbi:unnamed protein product [Paramecium primaurelia]|uniref:Transmembrane protein n=1 Tax=Paramecium primaurelia TaxID=5886 RepID=A0A8S1QNZ3_PARPR|nr:unnamed protein product [Paramecium primaurelia]
MWDAKNQQCQQLTYLCPILINLLSTNCVDGIIHQDHKELVKMLIQPYKLLNSALIVLVTLLDGVPTMNLQECVCHVVLFNFHCKYHLHEKYHATHRVQIKLTNLYYSYKSTISACIQLLSIEHNLLLIQSQEAFVNVMQQKNAANYQMELYAIIIIIKLWLVIVFGMILVLNYEQLQIDY